MSEITCLIKNPTDSQSGRLVVRRLMDDRLIAIDNIGEQFTVMLSDCKCVRIPYKHLYNTEQLHKAFLIRLWKDIRKALLDHTDFAMADAFKYAYGQFRLIVDIAAYNKYGQYANTIHLRHMQLSRQLCLANNTACIAYVDIVLAELTTL